MTATNEQIIEEAMRRWGQTLSADTTTIEDFIIEVVRENWTPPEPVDPDVLAFREWEAREPCSDYHRKEVLEGKRDHTERARAYLAGARMAREQERERGRALVEYVEADARRLDGVGGRALAALAKHRGEA